MAGRTAAVAVVIRCADAGSAVWNTLRSVERQTRTAKAILVADPSTREATRAWLRAVAGTRAHRFVEAHGDRPAVVKNAGLRATTASLVACVDAGCELHPSFVERTAERLADADLAAAGTWVERLGPGSHASVEGVSDVTLAECLSRSNAVDSSALFRRRDWLRAGGFDESLPVLESLDLWIGLLARGRGVAMIDEPLVTYGVDRDSLYRRAWDPGERAEAMTLLAEKHFEAFDAHLADLLAARDARLSALATRLAFVRARRDADVAETEALRLRMRDGLDAIPADARPVRSGAGGRITPVDRRGESRGTSIDRHYIAGFLQACAADISGDVLRVQSGEASATAGGEGVRRLDTLDVHGRDETATVFADLRCAPNLASESYDCILLDGTLPLFDDMPAALEECARLLKRGGVLLATLPCAGVEDVAASRAHWRITATGARRLFAERFGPRVCVTPYGNVAATAAFLHGLAVHELAQDSLDFTDPHAPLLVGVRAQKP